MHIHITDYLNVYSDSFAVHLALKELNDGDVLHLDGKKLRIDNSFATAQRYFLPRYSNECKYYAFYIENKKNIIIDGDGAELVFLGDVAPFGFDNCENITVKNFTVDYEIPYFWQAYITESCDEYFEVVFDENEFPCKYDQERKLFIFGKKEENNYWESAYSLACEVEESGKIALNSDRYFFCTDKPHPIYRSMSTVYDCQPIGENSFRFSYKDNPKHYSKGNYLVLADHSRKNCNFHFHRCKNIFMDSIDMYNSASFGNVFLLCENISANNVNSIIKPNTNRKLAVNADHFHCVNTKGTIKISNCIMSNMFDDAVNFHTLFATVEKKLDEHTILLKFSYLAKKVLNIFSPDEKICLLNSETFEKYDDYTVKKCDFAGDYHLLLETKEVLKDIVENSFVESVDAKATAYITGCTTNNATRGMLVTPGKNVLIEDCVFCNASCGISLNGASIIYCEGTAVDGLTVKNCNFENCAYLYPETPAILVIPRGITKGDSMYHKNLTISNNIFKDGKTAVKAWRTENLILNNNKWNKTENVDSFCRTEICDNVQSDI